MKTTPRRVAIIQARMSSSRFPGKVLAPLRGLPMIVFMARRVMQASRVDHLLVATSTDPSDDALADTLRAHGIDCFRGSLADVLDRFHGAALAARADHVVRLTGDCPLMDADLVDRALGLLADSGAHYVSNVAPPSYPDGLDVEAFTMAALQDAWTHAQLPSEREHVTLYLRAGHAHVRSAGWSGVADLSSLRWTVDHPDDLAHVQSLLDSAAVGAGVGTDAVTGFDRFDLYRGIERAGLQAGAAEVVNVDMSDGALAIVSHLKETRRFEPSAEFVAKARIASREAYDKLYKESLDDPDGFWRRETSDLVYSSRDRELVAGTHGRSIWIVDVLPIQELTKDVRAKAAHLFYVADVDYSRGWRGQRLVIMTLTGNVLLAVAYFGSRLLQTML